MYFKFTLRNNNDKQDACYRLVESYRSEEGRVCHCIILNQRFMGQEYNPEQINKTARLLTEHCQLKKFLTTEQKKIADFAASLWQRIVDEKRLGKEAYSPSSRQVDANNLRHNNV